MKLKIVLGIMLTLLMSSMVIVSTGKASLPYVIAQANSTTMVYLDPPTINGTAIGQEFNVSIMIRDAQNVYAWQVGLTFNATLLECTGFFEGEFLSDAAGPDGTGFIKGNINNTAGLVWRPYTAFLKGEVPGADGDGRLAYATFKVKAPGVSDIHLSDVKVMDYELKVVPVNIIDVYTVVLEATAHTVVTVSNLTGSGKVAYGCVFYGHAFNLTLMEISFKVTGPYSGFSNITIPKMLLRADPPRVWTLMINGTMLSTEERIITENETHTSIYFTYPASINYVQITPRFMPSTISIVLSEDSISLGENVTISGTVDPTDHSVRENVTVTIEYRRGGGAWTTLANVTTDSHSHYSHTWTPGRTGTYEVKASWEGDDYTFSNVSGVLTLTVKESSTISITLSSTNITLETNITINGTINPSRPNALVTILYKLGDGNWTTLNTVRTDQNSNYTYTWTPETAGTYQVKASWLGDDYTFGAESEVKNLTVQEAPEEEEAPGIPLEVAVAAVTAIIIIVAIGVYFVKVRKPKP